MFIEENCRHTQQAFSLEQINESLVQIPDWSFDENSKALTRNFKFDRYSLGPAFAVKVGEMADQQDHHPDLHIYYKKCLVSFSTHSAKGVSRNDFICAAKTDRIFDEFSQQR